MSILEDLLRDDLTENDRRIIVSQCYDNAFSPGLVKTSELKRSKTLGTAKSLLEFYELVHLVIDDYETRSNITDENRIVFTEEEPDVDAINETIVYSLVKRAPGAFGQGAPFEATVQNLRPVFRESGVDPTNPDYRQTVLGYWYDNVVRFTCWAKTNKAANVRAEWLEDLMEEYSWWFKLQGVNRVIYWGQGADQVVNISNIKWYGRPIDYFVRTEKLRVYSEKIFEEILLKIGIIR